MAPNEMKVQISNVGKYRIGYCAGGALENTAILGSLGKWMSETKTRTAGSPVEAARAMRLRKGFSFLDSSMVGPNSVSILACEPDLIMRGTDWDALEKELACRSRAGLDLGYPDGAAIGWVGYDGEFCFSFYDKLHVFTHHNETWTNSPEEFEAAVPDSASSALDFRPIVERRVFLEMVSRAKDYIAAGDIYQVCLSHPFVSSSAGNAWDYYEMLRHYSPAPFGAYIDGGSLQIASASPECFLRMSGRRIVTRPIKGTRPRKADPQSDQLSSYELMTSAKEIAELVMITDLERNDLGQVCEYGSVHVPELLHLETYEQVFHLVSSVAGELRNDVSHVQALRACFPGGSISGAPKKRAKEIIRELEPHPRGLYTGALGYFGYNGESQFSMTIRTAIFEKDRAHFHVGAGIVADSQPEHEWQETLTKASGLLLAANPHFRQGRE